MILIALALQAATATAPAPSAEAARLGTEVARSGTFAQLAPMLAQAQTDELVRDTPGLTLAEQAELRTIAAATSQARIARITTDMGLAYAKALSMDDLRAVLAFNRTGAATRYRAAEPNAMAAATKAMGGFDFKGDVLRALCAKTGKGCAAKAK